MKETVDATDSHVLSNSLRWWP